MKIKIKSVWPGIVWLVLSTIAFCIPGSSLPKNDWFSKIHFDKWVHVGIFAVMVVLWCSPLLYRQVQKPLPKLATQIAIAFFGYGILAEVTQHFLVSNRSFDGGDIAADAVGCLIGFFYVRTQWKV